MALKGIFDKLKKGLSSVGVDITDKPTIGSCVYAFNKSLYKGGEKGFDTDFNLNKDEHDFIRSALTAGRSEAINGMLHSKEITEGIDVVSLYPSITGACSDEKGILGFECRYPYGNPVKTDKFVKGKIGFYNVTIHGQKEGVHNVIPRRGMREDKTRIEDGLIY